MERNEILSKLNSVSDNSAWLKKAEKRRRNLWWKKHWNKVLLKCLTLKRKCKISLS